MNRRDFISISTSTCLLSALAPSLMGAQPSPRKTKSKRLFFNIEDIPSIRANSQTPLLRPLFRKWSSNGPEILQEKMDAFDKSGDIIRDFAYTLSELSQSAFVHLLNPSPERLDSLLTTIERLIAVPDWDYFLDGPDEVIGLQRASSAIDHLLLAREALSGYISDELDAKLLDAIAEKGCLPCYRAVYDMDHPDQVKGWRFNKRHADYYDIDMDRWPEILGANNLRSHPTSSLGLGALALRGHDKQADIWLETAISSARRVTDLFAPDGSYFEGISYAGYTLRTLLVFFEAHHRCDGSIKWVEQANFEGILHHILSTQMGRNADGTPDVVNFSDASKSVYPCVPAWIGTNTGDPVAQFAVENASLPASFLDFLWYNPKAPSAKPPKSLLNVHNDLDWVICRSGWEPNDAILAFKSGGPANHEHSDRNHITYKFRGERLLNDSFGAAYDRRDPHWLLRQTEAHNSVLINGQGNNYHDGMEGTNDSLSFANIIEYQLHGDTTWWTSDATAAYRIDNERIFRVLRTVIFAKPDIIVILDQIRLRYEPQPVSLRFFPDNRDELAKLTATENAFSINRPNATLNGQVFTDSGSSVSHKSLDLPEKYGKFPYIEIDSEAALTHEIVTVITAAPTQTNQNKKLLAQKNDNIWNLKVGPLKVSMDTKRVVPKIQIN